MRITLDRLAIRVGGISPCDSVEKAVRSVQNQVNPQTNCQVEAVDYRRWHAQQLSNGWVQLIFVPQHLHDEAGVDRGSLGEVQIGAESNQ